MGTKKNESGVDFLLLNTVGHDGEELESKLPLFHGLVNALLPPSLLGLVLGEGAPVVSGEPPDHLLLVAEEDGAAVDDVGAEGLAQIEGALEVLDQGVDAEVVGLGGVQAGVGVLPHAVDLREQ